MVGGGVVSAVLLTKGEVAFSEGTTLIEGAALAGADLVCGTDLGWDTLGDGGGVFLAVLRVLMPRVVVVVWTLEVVAVCCKPWAIYKFYYGFQKT